jgi:MATE family multidrug resistance protein
MAAQGIMKPAMYCAAIANVFNIIANYVFIYSLGLGYAGAPIATALGRWLSFLLLCLWTRMSGLYRTTWVNFSFRLLVEERALLLQFIKLGTAGGVALLFELWAFELTTLLASYLGELYLAAHVILLNVCTFSFMMPLGISVAASVRSANLLGEGNGLQARFSTIIAIACGASLMTLNGCIIYALRNVIAHAYTDDSDTIALVAQTAPYGAAFQIFDGTFTVSSGVLRGIGRHRAGAVMSGIGFYVLGVPLAYVFAFHTSIGFQGLWLGVCTGLFTMSCLVVGFLFCWVKWKKEAMLAIERMRKIKQEEGNACAGPDTASSVDKEMDEVTLLDHEVDASGGDDEVPADQDVQL